MYMNCDARERVVRGGGGCAVEDWVKEPHPIQGGQSADQAAVSSLAARAKPESRNR